MLYLVDAARGREPRTLWQLHAYLHRSSVEVQRGEQEVVLRGEQEVVQHGEQEVVQRGEQEVVLRVPGGRGEETPACSKTSCFLQKWLPARILYLLKSERRGTQPE
ncbi:unnamed protein product [Pleuronectes platessa]|uniref:Uncharacterized protein n=1 Tax=Pleuronectes platessa TaxID=8262 RepID=A0A9N7Y791_PLEPL|nr:unnamed protein product [Pleuronectes platessa]